MPSAPSNLPEFLRAARAAVDHTEPVATRGRIAQVVGTIAEASGPPLPLGARVIATEGGRRWEMEVIGFPCS